MPGLFPLSKLNSGWLDYFINAQGQVFSTKLAGTPRRLNGSRTSSGHYFTISPSNGYSTVTKRADGLLKLAKAHKDFSKETAFMSDTATPHESSFNRLKESPTQSSVKDREHAPSLAIGIKGRGYIIGQVQGEALVFGSKPKVHSTIKSVKAEIERLANQTPGLQLVWLQIQGSVRAASLVWE